MRWIDPPVDDAQALALGQALGVSPTMGALLCRRGLTEAVAARSFLNPRLASLGDPFRLTGMDRAVARLRQAMARGEKILVYGDYDVDGATSTALLIAILRRYGIQPRYFVPLRLEEGYGLSTEALDRALADSQPDLLIAVDCGTSSRAAVAHLRGLGIDVIILDHHASKEALPDDCILVNPHVWDEDKAAEGWSELSAVGIVFKFLHALLKQLRAEGDDHAAEIHLRDYLDLVALGTICDLVPLCGENRILATHGLQLMQRCRRVGLCALIEASGLQLGDEITPFDISFRLGPRINASGRLADASMPIELLLSDDYQASRGAARTLDNYNRERQEIERAMAEAAIAQVEAHYANDPGLVLFSPDWHPGVVGIVASRVAARFHRPTLVLGAEDGYGAKGSGRSIDGINLVEVLHGCSEHLERWGGHPMAVGLSVRQECVVGLRQAFSAAIGALTDGVMPEKVLPIDRWIDRDELSNDLLQELEQLAPYGQGNPEPVLALRGAVLQQINAFGNGHVRALLPARANGSALSVISWNSAGAPPPDSQPLDLAFRFHWNVWQGRKNPRITLLDWRASAR
jgi:single-stranded-DNA-specific exonuclease